MHTQNVPAQLTVLTPQLSEKLAAVNDATRALRILGVSVISQDLQAARPRLHISVCPPELAKIIKRQITLAVQDGTTFQAGQFMAVDVCWTATAAAARAASH